MKLQRLAWRQIKNCFHIRNMLSVEFNAVRHETFCRKERFVIGSKSILKKKRIVTIMGYCICIQVCLSFFSNQLLRSLRRSLTLICSLHNSCFRYSVLIPDLLQLRSCTIVIKEFYLYLIWSVITLQYGKICILEI